MPSPFSHAAAALSIATGFYRPQISKRFWVAGAACAVLPDLDVIGFRFGIPYADLWGHRGLTHSLLFAAVLAGAVTLAVRWESMSRLAVFVYLFLSTASHGVLDAMTSGGLGVAFFSPFNTHRYFLPWRPIRVSPISAARFFSPRGLAILENEFLWIWIPAIVFGMAMLWLRRRKVSTPANEKGC